MRARASNLSSTGAHAELDRRIVLATQAGLSLEPRPYHRIATDLGVDPRRIMERITKMLEDGRIRRIGLVPNHYRLGLSANGMAVWDVADDDVDAVGEQVAALGFVSHCYRRPRLPPVWRYNLFTMLHGKDRHEVRKSVAQIAQMLGDRCAGHDVLFSTRILKKTGLRFA
ncbi:MAG: Lrp/AsnC family transcriptional regulator [Gammaproteobacteria bacterium]|nr:Lrp/AsnC family transcriptional regulator [Gammaproteobacteria bacterium]